MRSVMWKSIIFISVLRSLWLLLEMGAMWFLVGTDGVFSTFDRQVGGFVDTSIRMVAYAIGFSWLLLKISNFGHAGSSSGQELRSPISASEYCQNQVSTFDSLTHGDIPDTDLYYDIPVDNQYFELAEDIDIGNSINPANGLPMVGAMDIEGNPFGTDTFSEIDCGFDDHISMGCSDSLFDDSSFGLSDDWI